MKPQIVLVVIFVAALLVAKLVTGAWQLIFSGNLAMCCMLCFTALGHFMFAKGMTMMIPPFIPFRKAWVYITGVAEVLMGIALMIPSQRTLAAYILILFFILILPANIYAAIKHVNLEKGTFDGPGPGYLWYRVPEQLFFVAWVYFFSIQGF
ncbi:DoxX family protein [Chitinophaga flava]|uniref:DoxX family protein n=1 Tax=Chitinophaga flava TaxID=2259036 RepID=A0A365XPD5_9BACT|nr:hypothetical protein [Chitinophaga flava]RBL88213.1 hypothetical protein DF182_16565 [Chitinophaga flava]